MYMYTRTAPAGLSKSSFMNYFINFFLSRPDEKNWASRRASIRRLEKALKFYIYRSQSEPRLRRLMDTCAGLHIHDN